MQPHLLTRLLTRSELDLVWKLDRSEVIHHIYRMEGDSLVRVAHEFEAHGWPLGHIEQETPRLYACFDRGGSCLGMFHGDQLVGAAVVDTLPLGPAGDQRQLLYLYVGRAYRGQGIGHRLMQAAQEAARVQGAGALYISATPTENTVHFYHNCGAVLALPPDPELLALEPEDIHFICPI